MQNLCTDAFYILFVYQFILVTKGILATLTCVEQDKCSELYTHNYSLATVMNSQEIFCGLFIKYSTEENQCVLNITISTKNYLYCITRTLTFACAVLQLLVQNTFLLLLQKYIFPKITIFHNQQKSNIIYDNVENGLPMRDISHSLKYFKKPHTCYKVRHNYFSTQILIMEQCNVQ